MSENETEKCECASMDALKSDLTMYQKEMAAVQEKLTSLEEQKTQLFRVGVRLEGVISYINKKMEEKGTSSSDKPEPV
jgi:predicted nuclease with TOPRIM domain